MDMPPKMCSKDKKGPFTVGVPKKVKKDSKTFL